MDEVRRELGERGQTFWQLAVVQLAGWTSLPILASGVMLLGVNSLEGAMITVVVGNAILWFLRLGMIALSFEGRMSTLDVSRVYLGRAGGYGVGLLLLVSTLAWYVAQTTSASGALMSLVAIRESAEIDQFTQMSVLLGLVSAFLCMEGIVLLRWLSTLAFPILVITFFVILFALPGGRMGGGVEGVSLAGLSLVLATNLGITADLPTFFRHSKDWNEAVKGLTVIQLVSLALGICSLFMGSVIAGDGAVLGAGSGLLRVSLVLFIFLSVICANVANVYSASVGWEVLAPKALVGRKEYLILGLALTTIFILISNLFSVQFMLNASDSSLVNLSVVLIGAFMVHRYLGRGPSGGEQWVYFGAWLGATLLNLLQYAGWLGVDISPFVVGLVLISGVLLGNLSLRAFQA